MSQRSTLVAALITVIATCGMRAASAAAQAAPASLAPDYSTFKQSYHIPFTKAVDFDHLTSLHVRVSINGGPPTVFQVDTGSVGIIVGASEVPDIDPKAPAGSIVYSSSGIELDGVWTTATVTFLDAKDAQGHTAVATVPVLAATETKSSGTGVNAGKARPPTKNPKVHMFGIGFGRGKEPHPERNAFLNLKEMNAGVMRRGYTITRDGFNLGLTPHTAVSGYLFQQLKERELPAEIRSTRPGLKDWATSRGWVEVGDQRLPEMPILIDTGLTNMMVPKPGLSQITDVPAGTPITVQLLGGQLHYRFITGDSSNPTAPRRVSWTVATPSSNVNTGLRALAVFDYLYDADAGLLGLRPTRPGA